MNESKILYNYFKQEIINNPNIIMSKEKIYTEYDIEIFSYVEVIDDKSCIDLAMEKINNKLEQINNIKKNLGL